MTDTGSRLTRGWLAGMSLGADRLPPACSSSPSTPHPGWPSSRVGGIASAAVVVIATARMPKALRPVWWWFSAFAILAGARRHRLRRPAVRARRPPVPRDRRSPLSRVVRRRVRSPEPAHPPGVREARPRGLDRLGDHRGGRRVTRRRLRDLADAGRGRVARRGDGPRTGISGSRSRAPGGPRPTAGRHGAAAAADDAPHHVLRRLPGRRSSCTTPVSSTGSTTHTRVVTEVLYLAALVLLAGAATAPGAAELVSPAGRRRARPPKRPAAGRADDRRPHRARPAPRC